MMKNKKKILEFVFKKKIIFSAIIFFLFFSLSNKNALAWSLTESGCKSEGGTCFSGWSCPEGFNNSGNCGFTQNCCVHKNNASGENPSAGTSQNTNTPQAATNTTPSAATTPAANTPATANPTGSVPTSAPSSSGPYTNQEKIPGAQPTQDFITYLKSIINFGFAIIGILALFMLIIGAYQYLMAVGSGNASDAKDTITSALLGLILGLTAWIILYKINPDLVNMRPITKITGINSNGIMQEAIPGFYSGGAIAVSGTTTQKIAGFQSDITAASQKYGVPENIIKAMMDVESSGNPNAKNPNSSASGLMQLTTGAAKDMGVTDVFNPSQNIDGGTHYLANNIKQTTGGVENGIAAYYTGINNFNKAGNWQNCSADTVAYVNKVMGKAQSY